MRGGCTDVGSNALIRPRALFDIFEISIDSAHVTVVIPHQPQTFHLSTNDSINSLILVPHQPLQGSRQHPQLLRYQHRIALPPPQHNGGQRPQIQTSQPEIITSTGIAAQSGDVLD